jgi:transposase InsO family protein
VEQAVLALRAAHPAWGGRKIARVLAREQGIAIAPSTVTGVLRRHGVPLGGQGDRAAPIRFEAEAPNLLWQMDFKGHVAMAQNGIRLHPLTVLDDHSRFALAIAACDNEREATVKAHLATAFRRYGLPRRMLMDNGGPWGTAAQGRFSALTVWLVEHGVAVSHARPLHPQTMGKDERFHRSLNAEVLAGIAFADLAHAQAALDAWRHVYNARRPHEALDDAVPLDRYSPSPREYRDTVEPFDYLAGDLLRRVQPNGRIKLHGRHRRVGRAFAGKTVALRPTETDGRYAVFFPPSACRRHRPHRRDPLTSDCSRCPRTSVRDVPRQYRAGRALPGARAPGGMAGPSVIFLQTALTAWGKSASRRSLPMLPVERGRWALTNLRRWVAEPVSYTVKSCLTPKRILQYCQVSSGNFTRVHTPTTGGQAHPSARQSVGARPSRISRRLTHGSPRGGAGATRKPS